MTAYAIVSLEHILFDVRQGMLIQYVHWGVYLLKCLPINTLQRHRLNSLDGATQAATGSLLLLCICASACADVPAVHIHTPLCVLCAYIYAAPTAQ